MNYDMDYEHSRRHVCTQQQMSVVRDVRAYDVFVLEFAQTLDVLSPVLVRLLQRRRHRLIALDTAVNTTMHVTSQRYVV